MILVTGGTGLVGAHLLLHLLENNETTIRAIYRTKNSLEKTKSLFIQFQKVHLFEKIEWLKADIIDVPSLEIAFKNIEFVYHCAAKISFNPSDEERLRKINIEGTANIVNFCIDKKVKKLCYVSSIAALGDLAFGQKGLKEGEKIITEETEWNPEVLHSDYAISKYGAEMEVWRGFQEGLQVVIVNPGIIIGEGFFNQGSGKIFQSVKKGLPFYTNGSTGYVGVNDVVKSMYQLMKSTINGERFIVISENKTYKDVIYKIAESLHVKKPTFEAKKWLLQLVSTLESFVCFIFRLKRKLPKTSVHSLVNKDLYSNEKIINNLGFSFEKVDETIERVSKSFK